MAVIRSCMPWLTWIRKSPQLPEQTGTSWRSRKRPALSLSLCSRKVMGRLAGVMCTSYGWINSETQNQPPIGSQTLSICRAVGCLICKVLLPIDMAELIAGKDRNQKTQFNTVIQEFLMLIRTRSQFQPPKEQSQYMMQVGVQAAKPKKHQIADKKAIQGKRPNTCRRGQEAHHRSDQRKGDTRNQSNSDCVLCSQSNPLVWG